eukprot:TRINITY_DN5341_c0_g2_i3.p1 TRINITY_DN5341_c0_g2~~TRINITY_DN5341_c0_g2_i3.p1  ORF type:complete len:227 (+),score=29.78 TRINITY_DN5341_c0_g2_i3:55-681(+)
MTGACETFSANILGRQNAGKTFYVSIVWQGVQCWSVLHRYSEFEKLSKELRANGVELPDMPRKSTFTRMVSKTFNDDRQMHLDCILRAAVKSDPNLENPALREFLLQAAHDGQDNGQRGWSLNVGRRTWARSRSSSVRRQALREAEMSEIVQRIKELGAQTRRYNSSLTDQEAEILEPGFAVTNSLQEPTPGTVGKDAPVEHGDFAAI